MSKYGNKKTVIDGITFDSKAEAYYYVYLKGLKEAGIIRGFERQPSFLLQEAFKKNGLTHRKITYKADFLVHYPDHSEIVDVKGKETEVFKLKRKLFEYKYPNQSLKLLKHDKTKGWLDLDTPLKKSPKTRKGTKRNGRKL